MFNNTYLLSAELVGVKNIDKKVKISFYKQTVDKSFDMSNYRIKAIFGENGCGKTALITAFGIVRDITLNGRYLYNKQNLLEEILNKKLKEYMFSCEYIVCQDSGNTVYKYSLHLSHDELGYYIDKESLSKKNGNYVNNNYKDVFVVENEELVVLDADETTFTTFRDRSLNLLRDRSFLSVFLSGINKGTRVSGYTFDMINLLLFMMSISVNISETDKHDMYMFYKDIGEKLSDNIESDYYTDLVNVITSTNDDIVSLELFDSYKKKIERMTRFIRLFKPELQNIDIDETKDVDSYKCKLLFRYKNYSIEKEFESTGIKKLITIFDAIDVACNGGIVFIDELDANINAIYLEKIIEYIIIYGKGQLCFSTHGLEIMDLLKGEKLAIEFLSKDMELVHWTAKGNNSPINYYKKGFIKGIPYNIDSIDFIDVFMENDE